MTGQSNIQFSIDYELDSPYDMIDRVEISYDCGFGDVVGLVVQSSNGNAALDTPYLGAGFILDSTCNNNPNIIYITISQIAFGAGTIYFNFENACLGLSINTGTLSPTIEPTTSSSSPTSSPPTLSPTTSSSPTLSPTPSSSPPTTSPPTLSPTTSSPTLSPTPLPTKSPTVSPIKSPTLSPIPLPLPPTPIPTLLPTLSTTLSPTPPLPFLNCGDTITGDTSSPDNFEDRFLFKLDYLGTITFSSCGSSFDTFARIYDINGNEIAFRYVLSIFILIYTIIMCIY